MEHKPIIETLINTAAIGLTGYGVINVTQGGFSGYVAIAFGMLLEFGKYYGRDKLW